MFKQLKEWFTKPSKTKQIETLRQNLDNAVDHLTHLSAQLNDRQSKMTSSEPWVEVKSASFEEAKGILLS